MKDAISVIIVTRGINGYLRSCLDSLKAQEDISYLADFETLIIDNSQDSGFSSIVKKNYPWARLLVQERNLYYCESLNLGIKVSNGDYVLCLNDDVTLDKNFIRFALEGVRSKPRIGMISGKVMRQDRFTLDSTGLFLTPFRTVKERGYGRLDRGQFGKAGFVFGVCGAAAFYKREMLQEIKTGGYYFDPAFHIFYEDLDIAWRANRRGWKGYYVPQALAFHHRGGTVRKKEGIARPFARRYLDDNLEIDLIKNRYLCMIRNESLPDLIIRLPFILLYEICQWGYILIYKRGLISPLIKALKEL
jgi:GT2 family glycosyltransferase